MTRADQSTREVYNEPAARGAQDNLDFAVGDNRAASTRSFDESFSSMRANALSGAQGAERDLKFGSQDQKLLSFIDVPPLNFGGKSQDKSDEVQVAAAGDKVAGLMGNRSADATSVANAADRFDGQKMWQKSPYAEATVNGKFGCAAAVSEVAQAAGFKYLDSPTVGGLVTQMERHGWTKHHISDMQPGDAAIGYNKGTNWKKGGGNAHVGFVGNDNLVHNNSSRNGTKWTGETVDVSLGKYDSHYVMRPPVKK